MMTVEKDREKDREKILKDTFNKRITIDPADPAKGSSSFAEQSCPDCQEAMVFALQIGEQTLSLGLTTILNCLSLAEEEGFVPRIDAGKDALKDDNMWWPKVRSLYRVVEIPKKGRGDTKDVNHHK